MKWILTVLIFFCCAPALSAQTATACDRLAAHPSDPDKLTEGVESEQVKIEDAIAACRDALKAAPNEARLSYQLGRVLFYKGERAEGFGYIEKAAKMRYRQAQFVAGYIYTEGYKDFTKADDCKALPLWRDAADRGHYASEVSLSRNVLRGVYAACGGAPDRARIAAYLESARKKTKNYYEQLLVDYLLEQAVKGGK